ncbi:MAG: hypothetical protein JO041_15645 [Acidobacteria bacterium]|nr:hypothetical protein [Acidobacteriota bacterium]
MRYLVLPHDSDEPIHRISPFRAREETRSGRARYIEFLHQGRARPAIRLLAPQNEDLEWEWRVAPSQVPRGGRYIVLQLTP